MVKAAAYLADRDRWRALGSPGSFWRDAMLLIIVGLIAIAGLSYFLVWSRKQQNAKSAR